MKTPAPAVLINWWVANQSTPPPPWGQLQNPEKQALLLALLEEQNYVCIYCGKTVTIDPHSAHIEHFWPQSKFQALRFDWANLFASCGPKNQKNTPSICGDAKASWTPTNHIDPADPQCERKFAYDGNGAISSSALGGPQATNMIKRLKLDDDSLDYERFLIVAELEDRIREGEIDASNVAQEIGLWRAVGSDGRLKGYGHVAARYLEDEPL